MTRKAAYAAVLLCYLTVPSGIGCHRSAPPIAAPARPAPATVTPAPASGTSAPTGNAALAGFRPTPTEFVSGPGNDKVVALTFDAGADDTAVPLLLKTLGDHHLHCTFFLTGAFCRQFPKQCKAIADAGMELGNHTFHHPHLTKRTDAQIKEELTSAEQEIVKTCGRGARPLFRFPYGDTNRRVQAVVASLGYQGIRWTLDSLDSVGKPKNADFVATRVIAKIHPGYITLMHVSRVESAKSLPRILDYLDKQGITVVPVSELLLSSATTQRKPHSRVRNLPSRRR